MTHEELRAAGYDVDAAAHERLAVFVRLLGAENARANLTGAANTRLLWRQHICDSLALLQAARGLAAGRLLDLGSGGGLPGLPLACVCPLLDVTLVDATRKKVAALRRMIARLGLPNARAVWGRAETLAHDPAYREQFDAVTARAVAALPALIEYAAGFVRPGGACWFFKSLAGADEERPVAESAARTCRLTPGRVERYRLPGDTDDRGIVIYAKEGVLPPELPRAPGRARKRPL